VETISDIQARIAHASQSELEALRILYASDSRKGVKHAFDVRKRQILREQEEQARLRALYDFDIRAGAHSCVLGMDEVGRGPLAGPMYVGGVVLNLNAPPIAELNDSKQIAPDKRERIAVCIQQQALAFHIESVDAHDIDTYGMAHCLRSAFSSVIAYFDAHHVPVECILLDGVPLHLDKRERAVVKGDTKSASIAAASIIAKVARDNYMVEQHKLYSVYGFDAHKGYGSQQHINAIKTHGICPLHRVSFCKNFLS